ncbi:hypothetical protein ACVWYF_002428 [Hymenobacter sp. UYAg731]
MQHCGQKAGASSPPGPGRRGLSYRLYAGLAAARGFVCWQQWQAWAPLGFQGLC